VFSRYLPGAVTPDGLKDGLIVVVNLDPHNAQAGNLHLDLEKIGLDPAARFMVHDELTGANFEWNDRPWVRLDPWSEVAHILSVRYPEGQER
jgi:starch synthase (maltosyl-transferring)